MEEEVVQAEEVGVPGAVRGAQGEGVAVADGGG